ncbi:MAG: integration host factor subunit alpha [Oligoflexia bacterium]|nr:integration host factor subunit alpha [Oligoflexia bacterium]
MTKARLVEDIHAQVGITKKEANGVVDDVFDIMRDALLAGDKLKISGFGNWVVRDKAARRGRNPQTNEDIIIARRRVLTFKPSQVLRAALNEDR